MHIGTSRADRLGFIVFAALAGLLALLLISTNGSSETATEVATFADLPEATAVVETQPVELPTPTPTPEPFVPLDVPETEEDEPEDEAEDSDTEADASTADGDAADEGTTDTAAAGTGETEQPAAAPAAETATQGDVPNPQPQASAVPNPQPQASAVPNPQPQASAVPNPQPQASAVPNPQPQTQTQNVNAPAPAPQGGTFTHTLTATVSRPTLYTSPGGSTFMPSFNGTALPPVNPTVFGNPLVYRVLAGTPDDGSGWAQVYVPARPNGTTAWVQTSQFRWGSSNRMLQINVSQRTITVFEGSNVLITTQGVLGKGSSRTPLANGWVEEIMAGPSAAYGPRLISLGIFSDDLNSFAGSVPKIALHGTNNPGIMGQYASNGCIRIRNEIITQIAGMLPVGSKVQIVG